MMRSADMRRAYGLQDCNSQSAADQVSACTIPRGATMRRADVNGELENLAFEFFYWFSRFEFALKENAFLDSHVVGVRASPGWNDFVKTWSAAFQLSPAAQEL